MNHQTEAILDEARRAISDPCVFSPDQIALLVSMIDAIGLAIDKEAGCAVSDYAFAKSLP